MAAVTQALKVVPRVCPTEHLGDDTSPVYSAGEKARGKVGDMLPPHPGFVRAVKQIHLGWKSKL